MARLRTNLIANVAGAGWSAAIQIACVPIFIKLLGVEAYGLIGFFVTLQVTLQVLDLGVSSTVNRQVARYSAMPDHANAMRDFFRTMEAAYWLLGLAISLTIILLAPVIANYWLRTNTLDTSVVRHTVELMGLIIALQWPLSFYQGGLMGLQRLVPLNLVRVLAVSVNTGGAVIVLWLFSPTLQAFFLWQLIGSLLHVVLIATVAWRSIPRTARRPRLDIESVRGILPFAKGMSGIVVLGTILSQMDKIVLSKVLTLTEFGYYAAAGVVAASLQLFITPIYSAIFPRLSGLVIQNDVEAIRRLYHTGTQLMAICVVPTAMVLAMWAPQVITIWTGNPDISLEVAPLAVLLLTGNAINGMMHIPYALQLAHGWTRLGLQLSLCLILVFLPLLLWVAVHHGAIGGALLWAVLNACYLVTGIFLTHRRLLKGDMRRWIINDLAYPMIASVIVISTARHFLDTRSIGMIVGFQVACVSLVAAAVGALSASEIREALFSSKLRSRLSFGV